MPDTPLVVAVVLHWCREDEAAACIASLLRSTYPNLRILLVDNASPDGSGDRLHQRFPDVEYLQTGSNLGYTGGNNRGLERALDMGADYILFVNDDAEVGLGTVEGLVELARDRSNVGAVAPKIVHHRNPRRIWYGGGRLSRMRATGLHEHEGALDGTVDDGDPHRVSFITGCCFLAPAGVMRRTGGFAEDFFAYVEDVELSLRLNRMGLHLWYHPEARVLHRIENGRGSETPFQIELRDRNRRRLARRHYSVVDRVRFSLFFYPTRLVRILQYLVRGDLPRARAIVKGMTAR